MDLLITEKQMYLSNSRLFIKRVTNFLCAIILLIILMPLLLIVAIITKLSSQGNIIYTQERIGLNKVPFTIYKFRSMYTNAEKNGPELSNNKDIRVTTWGKFMRKFKVDELPQLWNIIKGDMNFVGPRPEREYFIEQITQQGINYQKLLQIKPGLTSAGMVNYGYASTIEQIIKRMQFDIEYIEQPAGTKNFKIILQTISIVFTGKGK
ncbi:MAG: sugar transferase [Bacteroidetes bacterium]|nr:sugar transferase [Bacteroidota bacterium]MBS1648262.1 sugar transferase [Bacteroidota bacterium]